MGRGGGPSTRALAPPAAVHARLTVNRVVWRPTWAIADHPQDHDPHPADQGLYFEQILGFLPVTAKQEPERATRRRSSVSAPSATKMQETRNKMPAASVYLLENLHFLQFFVADSVPGSIILCKRR